MDYYELPQTHYEYYAAEYAPRYENDLTAPFLRNFAKEAPDLYRSGWPNPLAMAVLGREGVDIVINFAIIPDVPVPGGPKHLIHIPAIGDYPTQQDVIDFLQLINWVRGREAEGESHKMLIHCIWGTDRTGLMTAAYQRVFENKSLSDVETEYAYYGHTDFDYFEAMMGTDDQVEEFRSAAQYPPNEKYLRSFE